MALTTKTPCFQGVLADIDLHLLGEQFAGERAGIHRRMDLFAIGHQGIPGERVVMFPAGQLPDAADRALDSPEPSPCPQIIRS